MIYFFHHYELPAILQQARIQQIIIESQNQPTGSGGSGANGSDGTDGRGGSDGPPSTGGSNQNTASGTDQGIVNHSYNLRPMIEYLKLKFCFISYLDNSSQTQEESHTTDTNTTGNSSELNASSREPSIASQVEETDATALREILLLEQLGSVWNCSRLSLKQKLDLAVETTVQNKKISELNQLNTSSILLSTVQVCKAPTVRV